MSKDTCKTMPEVSVPNKGMEVSRLFKDLIDKEGFHYSRKLATFIYATYLNSNIEKQMEEAKDADGKPLYIKNRQGQFDAKDVVDFLNINNFIEDINNLQDEEARLGAVEYKGGPKVNFTDAEEVLNKVNDFNNSHKGLVATVNEYTSSEGEPIYRIDVYDKEDPNHVADAVRTRNRLQAWEIYKQFFKHDGIDITDVPKELKSIFNANNIDLDNQIRNLTKLEVKKDKINLYRKDALTLLYLNKDLPKVQNLIDKFGSIEDISNVVNDLAHKVNKITPEQEHLIIMTLNQAQKRLRDLDLDALKKQIDELVGKEANESPEKKLEQRIHELDKKWHIGINEIEGVGKEINNLSDANKAAIIQLKRRIAEIKKERGRTEEGKNLERLYNKLLNELSMKHYYNGIIDYLVMASKEIASINDVLKEIPQSGDPKANIIKTASILRNIKSLRDQYYPIVKALASDTLTMEEVESQIDKDNIQNQARELASIFEKKDQGINDLTKDLVKTCLRLSEANISEAEINEVLEGPIKEVSWLERLLYGVGTQSNVIANTMGRIIRNAQRNRDAKLAEFETKINKVTDKLYKAGYNTKFMYEDQRHIVSDIDWKMYEKARSDKEKALKKRGLKDFDLQEAMEEWEDANTEDRVVDKKTGRTERVPGKFYRKTVDFQDGWSQEQKEYYDTIMEYKGEVESLYPSYAQNLYLPPQVRRNFGDTIVDAAQSKSIKEGGKQIGKAIWNKLTDPFTIREDDTTYAKNGIINGEKTKFVEGNYDNTPKKEIPIYFQNPVKEGELMRDFSSAMLHLVGSAYRYSAMNEIRDTVETLRDFVASKEPVSGTAKAEVIADRQTMKMTQRLYSWAKQNNVSAVMNGFIDQYVYDMKRNPNEVEKHPWLSKLVDTTIAYTSFKGLATNIPGAFANGTMGVTQILIDANSGEFFGYKDLGWTMLKLFGKNGILGDAMDSVTNNINSKAGLLQKEYNPMQENFENIQGKRYYNTMFRRLLSKDFSYMGYGAGEYLIHLVPMYAILHKQKVKLDGKEISLYDAYDVKKENGNSELVLKDGVTDLDGNPVTQAFIDKIKGRIKYANQSMHGAMNEEERGLVHQYMLGRLAINFKQWMIGHYSRRFRERHIEESLGEYREGYYTSVWKMLINNNTKDALKYGHIGESARIFGKDLAVFLFGKDLFSFFSKAAVQWDNLSEMQKYNIRRARAEICMLFSLMGLSMALGDPDKHKGDFWRRWWIYQTKRMITETEASTPITPKFLSSGVKVFQSPMAGVNTWNSLLYALYGIRDLGEEVQSGPHKGENVYIRNMTKYTLPFFKDWERLQTLGNDDSLFKVFDDTPSNH